MPPTKKGVAPRERRPARSGVVGRRSRGAIPQPRQFPPVGLREFLLAPSAVGRYFVAVKTLARPEVILTHESDLDGFVAGLLLQRLARHLFNAEVPLEAFHYNNWRLREPREKVGWVCDLTFEPRLDKPDWLVVDHHVSDLQPKAATVIHDLAKSAGLLCYELCREHGLSSPELDRLVHLNNVADLFLEAEPEFIIANDYANLVKSYQFWNLHAIIEGQLERLLDHPLLEVMAVKRRIEDPIGYDWSRQNVMELSPTVGYVDTVVGNTNLIVHQLLEKKATRYTVLATLFRKGSSVVVSLRSRNGDALKIAALLQGGGHANASGATLPRSVKVIPDAIDYLRTVLNPPQPLNSMEGLLAGLEIKAKG